MSDKEFIFREMTPELQEYLEYQANFPKVAQQTYKPLQEREKAWEEAGKPEAQKVEIKALREAHYASNSAYREKGEEMRAKLGNLVERYYKARKVWMCREDTKVEEREVLSPSGRYKLTISSHSTGKGTWNYTKCRIKEVGTMCGPVGVVYRNYGTFPHLFVEDHPNGHDYLICGEDYQGQTIIELDTGERRDYLPKEAAQGHGFCWASYTHSPSKRTLAVNGCYWACPYEVWMIDFDNPLEGLPVLYKSRDCDEFVGWDDGKPDTCDIGESYEICTIFGDKREDDLTEEEWDECSRREDEGEEVWREVTNAVTTWSREAT